MLEDQTVAIDAGGGIDTKSDPKQTLVTKMAQLQNRVFSKIKQLKKDFGFDRLSDFAQGYGTPISNGSHVSTYNDELVIVGSSAVDTPKLSSYSESASRWLDRGSIPDCTISSGNIIQNNFFQKNTETVIAGNYQSFSWVDSRGGVRASIKDLTRNVFIISDQSVSTTAHYHRAIQLDSTTIGFIYGDATGEINIRTWSSSPAISNSFSAETSIATGLNEPMYFDAFGDGTRRVVVYTGATITDSIFAKLNADGTVASTTTVTDGVTTFQDYNIVYDSSTDRVWVMYAYVGGGLGVYVRNYTSTASVMAPTLIKSSAASYFCGVGYISSTNTLTAVYSYKNTSYTNFTTWKRTINTSASLGTESLYHTDSSVCTRAFAMGTSYYVGLITTGNVYTSSGQLVINDTTQPTLFITRASDAAIVGRALTDIASPEQSKYYITTTTNPDFVMLPHTVASLSSSKVSIPFEYVREFKTDSQLTIVPLVNSKEIVIERPALLVRSSVQANNVLLLSGGVTSAYDGVAVVEAGFHKSPEGSVTVFVGSTETYLDFTVTNGTAGTPEVFTILFSSKLAADLIEAGQYFTYTSSSGNMYIWFKRNAQGTDPAVGGATGAEVNLTGDENNIEIAQKVAAAINSLGGATAVLVSNLLTVTNSSNGNVTSAANVNVATHIDIPSSATYQYCAIYEWVSAKGEIVRSRPQLLYDATGGALKNPSIGPVASDAYIALGVSPLTLTSKNFFQNNVIVKFYRTTNGGSVFYLVSSNIAPTVNDASATSISFVDVLSDAAIVSRETLYTTGGVIENDPYPPTSKLIVNRDRLYVIDSENDQLWASKTLTFDTQPEMTEAFTISVDSKGDSLVTMGEMDDKVILFKDDQPYYIFGDGPNDVGAGGFPLPEPIISPVGASEKNSVIKSPIGLMFKSLKGIYVMGRDLATAFIGAPVEDFNSSTVYDAHILPDLAQIRFLLSSDKFLIYDYDMEQWSTRTTESTPVSATIWKNKYVYLQSNGRVWVQNSSVYQDNLANVVTMYETGWLNLNGLQGFQRVKRLELLGEYKSAHTVTVDIGYDYAQSYDTVNNRYTFTPTGSAGDPLQFEIHLKQQKCEAIRIKVTEGPVAGTLLEGNSWAHMQLIVGVKKGMNKLPASKKV